MKKKGKAEDGEMRAEYDFTEGRRNPYIDRIRKHGSNLVLIEPDLYKVFPNSDAVNDALRLLVKAGAKAMKAKPAKQAKAS